MEYRVDSWWEAHPRSQPQAFKGHGQLRIPLEYEAVLGTPKARFRAEIWELILFLSHSLSPSLPLSMCLSIRPVHRLCQPSFELRLGTLSGTLTWNWSFLFDLCILSHHNLIMVLKCFWSFL